LYSVFRLTRQESEPAAGVRKKSAAKQFLDRLSVELGDDIALIQAD